MHTDHVTTDNQVTRRDQVFDDEVIQTTDAINYTPFIKDGRVGYRVDQLVGEETVNTTWLYFNPSDGTDDGVPNVFVYLGTANDPCQDSAEDHHIIEFPNPSPGEAGFSKVIDPVTGVRGMDALDPTSPFYLG